MKLGSLFDGSGTCPLAASAVGITPVWASEVEPYPVAVTRSRFPNMTHLGSVTDIHGRDIEPVDIITFGSPCQDLSVAGKRAGLKHESNGDDKTTRSGLFMEAVRIIKEMREATNGKYPTFAVWENVPGAFSSNKGEDFRTVLEELIKIVEPTAVMPAVPKNGWAYADSYIGDRWSLAYRVLDAQYWGVPQRRRRIYLVLDLRGQRAREVLFEREGLRRDFTKSGTPWQGTAGDAQDCAGADDRAGESGGAGRGLYTVVPYTLKIRSGCDGGGKGALIQTDKSATLATNNDQYLFQPVPNLLLDDQGGQQVNVRTDDKCPTLRAEAHGNVPIVLEQKACSTDVGFFNSYEERSPTLLARMYKDPPLVAYPESVRYIVRRLTPTECARLQGFADRWGDIEEKKDFTPEDADFWATVRNTHATINGKPVQPYTKAQMLTWYNKLHTDSSEYKMWGNGMAFPCMLYIMEGVQEVLTERYLKNLFGGDTSDR